MVSETEAGSIPVVDSGVAVAALTVAVEAMMAPAAEAMMDLAVEASMVAEEGLMAAEVSF